MKLRVQILVTVILAVLLGVVHLRNRSARNDRPHAREFSYITSEERHPYKDKYGTAEDSWPGEVSETTVVNKNTTQARLGGATATYTNYVGPQIAVQADVLQLWGDLGDGVVLSASFITMGNKVREPKEIALMLVRYTPANKKFGGQSFTIMARDSIVASDVLPIAASSRATLAVPTTSEVFQTSVSYQAFKRAVELGELSIGLGDTLARLNDAQLRKLQSMIRIANARLSFPENM